MMIEGSRPGYEVAAGDTVAVRPRRSRRISWGAIFAGVVMVLAVQLLLSMLGIGIGLSMVSPAEGDTPSPGNLGIESAVWWGVSYLIALFLGGFVASRLAAMAVRLDGALHGLLTWAFTLLVTFYLLSTAVGNVIGGAFSAVGSTLSAAGQGLKNAAPQIAQVAGIPTNPMADRAKDLLNAPPSNADLKAMSREQAEREIAANLPKLAAGRDRITAILSVQLNISPREANARLDQMQGQLQQTKEQATDQAKQAADKAATGLSRASLIAFAALLLGAGAAALGGRAGVRRREVVARM
jgi:hypothetical protein